MTDHERWGRESEGGIFGSDIDYEMHEAMFQDAAAAGRARYGEAPRNRHVRALLDARERRATRAEMLIFQRFIDEIPDTLRWIKKSTSERVVTVACWALGVDYFEYRATDDERVYVTDDIEQTPITGRMIAARVVDRAKAIVSRLIHGEPPPSPEVRTDVAHARMWTEHWSEVLVADDRKAADASSELLGEDPSHRRCAHCEAVRGAAIQADEVDDGGSVLGGEASSEEEDALLLVSVAKTPT
jgi:hypothetical protein